MRELPGAQGTPEWIANRIGLPTASQFGRIIQPTKLCMSTQAIGYIDELLAEWMLGRSLDEYIDQVMMRGMELEADAINFYEMQRDCEVTKVGLIVNDEGTVGCSPDGTISIDGGLEIKCPLAKTHMGYLRRGMIDKKYVGQIQGALWITEREWWDVLSYNPFLPPALLRVHRDDKYIAALAKVMASFVEELEAAKETLIAQGHMPAQKEESF
jgi:hypothetical protein